MRGYLSFWMLVLALVGPTAAEQDREMTVRDAQRIRPIPPAGVTASAEKRKAKPVTVVNWKKSPLEKIVAYEVHRRVTGGKFRKIARVSKPPYIDSQPIAGAEYAVAAVDVYGGVSPLSSPASAR
jgi:hypothetical protein